MLRREPLQQKVMQYTPHLMTKKYDSVFIYFFIFVFSCFDTWIHGEKYKNLHEVRSAKKATEEYIYNERRIAHYCK